MPIRAGTLRDPIALERRGTATDDLGTEVGTWTLLARTRAQVSYGTGQERRQAAQEQASMTATFRVRRSSVTAALAPLGDRVRFDPSATLPADPIPADFPAWDITSVAPFERDAIDITAVLAV